MKHSQEELAQRFVCGQTEGKASNVQIIPTETGTALVGHGIHVLFERDSDTETITKYAGWYGHRTSLSGQITRLERGIQWSDPTVTIDKRSEQKNVGELHIDLSKRETQEN